MMKRPQDCEKLHSKEEFRELMLALLEPLKPHYSEGCARLTLGATMAHYDINATWMEAFSRPLWGLVPFWAGGGKDSGFEEIYRRGLTCGTNPEHPEYWGECTNFDQRFVEMAAMAYGIMFAPEVVWNPLSGEEKSRFAAYLNKINEHPLPVCNWILFAVLVNIALKKAGFPYSEKMLGEYLNGLETFYLGDGWYQDGDSGQKDYYISFAIHFYCLIYAKVMEEEDPDRAKLYKDRAGLFAKQFIYWFDEDGDGLPFGRSLTYRFSQVSFFSACLLAGIEPFPVPVMKGLIVRHLKQWMKRPIFDRDNILTIGYGYPQMLMAENYNAPGSPYWAMKVFAFLMLPDEHEFWSAKAAPYPELPEECPMPYADMFVRHYKTHVTAYAPGVFSSFGHGHSVAKYGKFAYDTKFAFSIPRSSYEIPEIVPDSMLAFMIDGNVYVRRICQESAITKDGVYSKWSPYPGICVETTIAPTKDGHRRVHRITSKVCCEAWDCGFSVDRGDMVPVGFDCSRDGTSATAKNNHSLCKVEAEEKENVIEGEIIYSNANTNILHPKTVIPSVKYRIVEGEQILITKVTAEYNGR